MFKAAVTRKGTFAKSYRSVSRKASKELKKAVQDGMEVIKKKIADYAPGSIKQKVLDLPTTRVRTRGLTFNLKGTVLEAEILLGRRKDKVIYWVNNGTGIYGPTGKRIVPKTAKYLRYTNKAGKVVFARSVRGQKPQKFIEKGFWSARGGALSKLKAALRRIS